MTLMREVEVMHKIDLTNGILKPYRFVCLQLVVIMFMILLTYKWAFTFTQVIEQSILINVTFGIIGFLVMLIVHKLIHKMMYFILSKAIEFTSTIKRFTRQSNFG